MGSPDQQFIESYLRESAEIMRTYASDPAARQTLAAFADAITLAFRNDNKLLIAGNGGSAGDSQHIAGEFISRLFFDHAPLPAIALTTDTSVLTAVGNDYGYEKVFERQVLGLGRRGDVFLGISTSGKSPNVLRAFEAARKNGMVTLGFTGNGPGAAEMVSRCDLVLKAPTDKTALIQQVHIVAAHIVCGLVEERIFGKERASAA
jgi:D-sedoheptulose 7-phosphate isomerase